MEARETHQRRRMAEEWATKALREIPAVDNVADWIVARRYDLQDVITHAPARHAEIVLAIGKRFEETR